MTFILLIVVIVLQVITLAGLLSSGISISKIRAEMQSWVAKIKT